MPKWAAVAMTLVVILFILWNPFSGVARDQAPESNRVKTFKSLVKLDDFPLYGMRFYGDYPLPEYAAGSRLSQVALDANSPILSSPWACTCFSASAAQGGRLLGRNFDWQAHPALLLYTNPPNRYASVSLVDISYLGYTFNDSPEKNPGGLFQSPLLPFDGMNERGLAVGMMAVPSARPTQDPLKRTVGGLMAIRLMLDNAKNVDEALAVFKNFNVDFSGGPPLHYFVADRTKSVIIELVDGRISELRSSHPWQVATNFVISGLSPEEARASCWRYDRVLKTLESGDKAISASAALSLLKDVSQPNTIWSVVYDTLSLSFLVVMGQNFDRVHEFSLKRPL